MINGWFVGNFFPSAFNTDLCEVAVKKYKKDELNLSHYHKISTEITLVLTGIIQMNDQIFNTGDIIVVSPGEKTTFRSITDSVLVVVKTPGAINDKFI
jgi:quercetin dioxygenase-like cupin family protein